MIHTLAWRQLVKEKRRLLAALAGIMFAVFLQLMQLGFREALFESATMVHNHLRADLVIASTQYEYLVSTGTIPRQRLQQAAALPAVASVAPIYVGLTPFKNPTDRLDHRILAIGIDPGQSVFDVPEVDATRHLLREPDVILFDALSRQEFGPIAELLQRDGAVVTEAAGRRAWVRGVFNLGASFGAPGNLVTSDTTFRRWFNRPEGSFEFGLVRLRAGADVEATRATLRSVLPGDVQVLTRQEFIDVEHAFWDAHTPIGLIFTMGAAIGLLVGCVVVYQILYTDVTNHLAEYATLKAMGYRDRDLYMVVLDQSAILSIGGFPVAFVLAVGFYHVVREATHLPIDMTLGRAAFVLGLTLVMSMVSGAIAMRKLRSADPADVF